MSHHHHHRLPSISGTKIFFPESVPAIQRRAARRSLSLGRSLNEEELMELEAELESEIQQQILEDRQVELLEEKKTRAALEERKILEKQEKEEKIQENQLKLFEEEIIRAQQEQGKSPSNACSLDEISFEVYQPAIRPIAGNHILTITKKQLKEEEEKEEIQQENNSSTHIPDSLCFSSSSSIPRVFSSPALKNRRRITLGTPNDKKEIQQILYNPIKLEHELQETTAILQTKDEQIQLAAAYGNSLLEANEALMGDIEKTKQQQNQIKSTLEAENQRLLKELNDKTYESMENHQKFLDAHRKLQEATGISHKAQADYYENLEKQEKMKENMQKTIESLQSSVESWKSRSIAQDKEIAGQSLKLQQSEEKIQQSSVKIAHYRVLNRDNEREMAELQQEIQLLQESLKKTHQQFLGIREIFQESESLKGKYKEIMEKYRILKEQKEQMEIEKNGWKRENEALRKEMKSLEDFQKNQKNRASPLEILQHKEIENPSIEAKEIPSSPRPSAGLMSRRSSGVLNSILSELEEEIREEVTQKINQEKEQKTKEILTEQKPTVSTVSEPAVVPLVISQPISTPRHALSFSAPVSPQSEESFSLELLDEGTDEECELENSFFPRVPPVGNSQTAPTTPKRSNSVCLDKKPATPTQSLSRWFSEKANQIVGATPVKSLLESAQKAAFSQVKKNMKTPAKISTGEFYNPSNNPTPAISRRGSVAAQSDILKTAPAALSQATIQISAPIVAAPPAIAAASPFLPPQEKLCDYFHFLVLAVQMAGPPQAQPLKAPNQYGLYEKMQAENVAFPQWHSWIEKEWKIAREEELAQLATAAAAAAIPPTPMRKPGASATTSAMMKSPIGATAKDATVAVPTPGVSRARSQSVTNATGTPIGRSAPASHTPTRAVQTTPTRIDFGTLGVSKPVTGRSQSTPTTRRNSIVQAAPVEIPMVTETVYAVASEKTFEEKKEKETTEKVESATTIKEPQAVLESSSENSENDSQLANSQVSSTPKKSQAAQPKPSTPSSFQKFLNIITAVPQPSPAPSTKGRITTPSKKTLGASPVVKNSPAPRNFLQTADSNNQMRQRIPFL